MNELDIFSRSIKDFFTFKMLKIALVPLLVTIFIVYLMFFTAADYGISSLQEVAKASQNGQEVVIDPNAPVYYEWAANSTIFLFQYSITSWLAIFLIYTIGSLLMLQVSVILTLALIGFLVPMILKIVHKRHYSHITLHGHGNLLSPVVELFKSGFIMILLYIVLIPLYFIPLINVIAFSFPLYYFFHKLLNHDVSTEILSDDEYEQIYKKNANSFRLRTLFLYIVSLIPFITLFTAVFYVIYLGHAYFIKLEKLRLKLENKS
ncbi:MAG: EI24 domain-containing protein [Campylobacterota bacterium]